MIDQEDEFIKKIIKDAPLGEPSQFFSESIMEKITALCKEKKVYKPLISSRVWWALGIIYLCPIFLAILFPLTPTAIKQTDSIFGKVYYEIRHLFIINFSLPYWMFGFAVMLLLLLFIDFILERKAVQG